MPTHHPGTFVVHNNLDLTSVPRALTTHLLSRNHEQLLRTTRHPFLARAANGTLSKSLIAQWLANSRVYLEGYTNLISTLLRQVQSQQHAISGPSDEASIQTRISNWLEAALQNARREAVFFEEVAGIYNIDASNFPLHQNLKSEGLRRFENLFATFSAQQHNSFLPWLEGLVLVWATEKVYYEAWSWARRQDAQSSPRTFDRDEDGGAMRREFIPNWSNRDLLMFVERLERILNEGVSQAVANDDARWMEVKTRTDQVWKAVLDAEDAFWPEIPEMMGSQIPAGNADGARASSFSRFDEHGLRQDNLVNVA